MTMAHICKIHVCHCLIQAVIRLYVRSITVSPLFKFIYYSLPVVKIHGELQVVTVKFIDM